MDDQFKNPLIRQDISGTYCLGFKNKSGLDVEEIRTIFSAFGKVVHIKETGDKGGYRFVRYRHIDEAEKAIEGLKYHAQITLVEHRPYKINKSEYQMNENRKNYFNRNDNKYQISNGLNKNDSQNSNINFNEENQKDNGNFTEENQCDNENFEEKNQTLNESENGKKKENSSNEHLFNAKSCNSLNSISDDDAIKHNALQMHNKKSNLVKTDSLTSSLSEGSRLIEDNYDCVDIPDLIKIKKSKIINKVSKRILNAEEIIVGNIPEDFGSAFFLHLFQRYDPIAISNINFVRNSAIRYCHVYFKTIQDAVEVEKTFDRMNLSDKKLVVLRPCQLIPKEVC